MPATSCVCVWVCVSVFVGVYVCALMSFPIELWKDVSSSPVKATPLLEDVIQLPACAASSHLGLYNKAQFYFIFYSIFFPFYT